MPDKIKVNFRPDPVDLGRPQAYKFPSQSRAGMFHYTLVGRFGVICSCEGWQNTGHCWHVDKIPVDQPEDTSEHMTMDEYPFSSPH